jgi:dolichol-phosphate mannosyltransferase
MLEVFVVLPAYNEGEALRSLLCELEEVLAPQAFRILVVDDGSTDGSIAAIQSMSLPHVEILTHPQNRGLGEAMRTGLSAAVQQAHHENDIIIVMDSDCTHTPYLIERMISLVKEGNDVVIASRFRYGARVIGLSLHRLFLSHAASWVFRLFVPIPNVKDYTCGYRAYRAGLVKRAFETYRNDFIRETGFSCMVDILIKLARMDAIITEVPLILRYDRKESTSKMKILRTIRSTLKLLFRTLGEKRQQPKS